MASENATYLFEGKHSSRVWPASSESFWTALFGLFALYLGEGAAPRGQLTIGQPTVDPKGKPYEPRAHRSTLQLHDLEFDSIAIEPRAISKCWPGTSFLLSAATGGFSPDVLIRICDPEAPDHFLVIENKVTYAGCLADNQVENYPRLAAWLIENAISFDILFLHSVGSCHELYAQAKSFQRQQWGAHFGILLWEEVLQKMLSTGFAPPGIPIESWQPYTTALDTDCVRHDQLRR